ncbi:MAG TPA: helix-turn-helix transcriptional regulator [Caulobacteraceae bacterium]|jgi:transcriptional regulator with XRE-family HTH domain
MIHDLPLGPALRRHRRLNGIKQAHLAELLGISQGTVSRWESGAHQPDPSLRAKIARVVAARTESHGDAALKRLVSESRSDVHLVCDATHRLLAASATRAASWRGGVADRLGVSLWPYATPEIVAAEEGLRDRGWFEGVFQTLCFETGPNGSPEVPVPPSVVRWETVPLADGRVGRLTTTVRPA